MKIQRTLQVEMTMKPISRARPHKFLRIGAVLLSAGLMNVACTKEVEVIAQPHPVPQGWITICLGRYLLDLPPGVQLGAANPKYKYTGGLLYNFKGFRGSGSGDVTSYATHLVAETHPIPLEWRDEPGKNPSFALIKGDAKIKYTKIKADEKKRGDQKSANLTGPININFPNSYAYNAGGVIDAGFYSPLDQRARLFSANTEDEGGTFEQAAAVVNKLFTRYRPRVATDIPKAPGVCTPYGFFADPPNESEREYSIAVPLRSTTYPNLLFVLRIETADPGGPATVDDVANPNKIGIKDINAAVLSAVSGVKRSFGPDKVQFAGQTGRVIGREYRPNALGGGTAYEVEALAVGESGSIEKPAITFSMAAALPFIEQPPQKHTFDDNVLIPWVDERPLLKGTTPPLFDEGMKVFYQVLGSLRPRPGAIVATVGASSSKPPPMPSPN